MGTGESKLNDDLVLLEDEGEGFRTEICLVETKTSTPKTIHSLVYMSIGIFSAAEKIFCSISPFPQTHRNMRKA